MKRIPQETRELQIREVASNKGHLFKGFMSGYENKSSKLIIQCPNHGEWNPSIENYLRNKGCPECNVESRRLSDVEDHICKSLPSHINFVRFQSGYRNQRSKVVIHCNDHGGSVKSVTDIINKSSYCRECGFSNTSLKRRSSIESVITNIESKCKRNGYSFKGFVDGYKNNSSFIILECHKHGVWVTRYANFMKSRHGCPNCRNHGYKQSINGYVYLLRSTCGCYMKIGITNDPQVRIKELKWYTPFDFNLSELIKMDAQSAIIIEKGLHSMFDSANMNGFNGATEWFLWDDTVNDVLR